MCVCVCEREREREREREITEGRGGKVQLTLTCEWREPFIRGDSTSFCNKQTLKTPFSLSHLKWRAVFHHRWWDGFWTWTAVMRLYEKVLDKILKLMRGNLSIKDKGLVQM